MNDLIVKFAHGLQDEVAGEQDKEQLMWLHGFLQGLCEQIAEKVPEARQCESLLHKP
jgi:hypothetical protein